MRFPAREPETSVALTPRGRRGRLEEQCRTCSRRVHRRAIDPYRPLLLIDFRPDIHSKRVWCRESNGVKKQHMWIQERGSASARGYKWSETRHPTSRPGSGGEQSV